MLSNKKDNRLAFPLTKGLLCYRLLKEVRYKGELVGTNKIMFLVSVMSVCWETNDFARSKDVFALMGVKDCSRSDDNVIPPLIRLGLVDRPGWGLFVLTNEGEYFLRDIETMLSRITKNSVRSKWRKIKPDEVRAKYVRKKRVKGLKIVAVPVDDRHKLKHGIPVVKKNGQPRNINLPGFPSI